MDVDPQNSIYFPRWGRSDVVNPVKWPKLGLGCWVGGCGWARIPVAAGLGVRGVLVWSIGFLGVGWPRRTGAGRAALVVTF